MFFSQILSDIEFFDKKKRSKKDFLSSSRITRIPKKGLRSADYFEKLGRRKWDKTAIGGKIANND